MEIIKIIAQKNKKPRFYVFFDNNYKISISDGTLVKFGLRKGDTISDPKLAEILKEEEQISSMNSALNLLRFQSRTRKELHTRLKQKKHPSKNIEQTIDKLEKLGYINDLEYAKSRANFLFQSGKGPYFIKFELLKKGVNENIVNEIIKIYEIPSEKIMEKLVRITAKKLKTAKSLPSHKTASRILSFLSRNGHSIETSRKVLKNLKLKITEPEY